MTKITLKNDDDEVTAHARMNAMRLYVQLFLLCIEQNYDFGNDDGE